MDMDLVFLEYVLNGAVQANCSISPMRGGGVLSLCVYVMEDDVFFVYFVYVVVCT